MMLNFEEKEMNGGVQRLFVFDNGYGASVIKHKGSYGFSEGLWELAVIIWSDDVQSYNLDYSTPITDDVIGYLAESEVDSILKQIMELPSKK